MCAQFLACAEVLSSSPFFFVYWPQACCRLARLIRTLGG